MKLSTQDLEVQSQSVQSLLEIKNDQSKSKLFSLTTEHDVNNYVEFAGLNQFNKFQNEKVK